MTRQFFRSKKKLLIALAVIIVCLVSLCYTFFPRSVTGLQIIPELSDATSAQILYPDWTASHGIVLEGIFDHVIQRRVYTHSVYRFQYGWKSLSYIWV